MSENIYDAVIVGGGPAAYTATIYTIRAGLNVMMIAGIQKGGQLMGTQIIENWPGAEPGLTGPELMMKMNSQVIGLGVNQKEENVVSISKLSEKVFELQLSDNSSINSKSVIWCTGAIPRRLNLSSEKAYFGKGVSTCATCDGFIYINRPVAVIGGGDHAFEEALYLSDISSVVYLIHRRDKFKAEHLLLQKIMEKVNIGKIKLYLDSVVEEILGTVDGVNSLKIKNINNSDKFILNVDAIFVAIGHIPSSECLQGFCELDSAGYVKVGFGNINTRTSQIGLYAAGDVVDYKYRQAITAASMGCQAAIDLKDYLKYDY